MIWISNFNHFSLLEKYGVPDFAISLSTEILASLFKNKFTSYNQTINNSQILDIKSIDITIVHNQEDFSSKFQSDKNELFDNLSLEFDIPTDIKSNWYYLHEIIIHEITHLYEFYKIIKNNKSFPFYNKIKKGLMNTIGQDNIDPFNYFRNIVYLTLDNELNARVSQVYIYLKQTHLKDPKLLLGALKNSSSWKKMELISKFNYIKYTDDLIDTIGIEFSFLLVNTFNDELKNNDLKFINNTDVNTKQDLLKYFQKWSKRFKYKMKKHKNNLEKTIYNFI